MKIIEVEEKAVKDKHAKFFIDKPSACQMLGIKAPSTDRREYILVVGIFDRISISTLNTEDLARCVKLGMPRVELDSNLFC